MAKPPKSVLRDLGIRLRELRSERDLTQEKLAERLEMDPGNYAHIEQGIANVTVKTLARISDALDVPIYELFVPPTDRHVPKGRPRKKDSLPTPTKPSRRGATRS